MLFSFWVSKYLTRNKIPSVAIAIIIGLSLALLGIIMELQIFQFLQVWPYWVGLCFVILLLYQLP